MILPSVSKYCKTMDGCQDARQLRLDAAYPRNFVEEGDVNHLHMQVY